MAELKFRETPIIDEYEYLLDAEDVKMLNMVFKGMFGMDCFDVRVHADNGYWQADVKAYRKVEEYKPKYCDSIKEIIDGINRVNKAKGRNLIEMA